jgi:hypothetical protein
MPKVPKNISLIDAARIVTLPIGIVVRDLKAKCVTGNELVPTSRLKRQYKIPKALFEKLLTGDDKLISRAEAASLMGVRKHCLQRPWSNRPAIVPVVTVGKSPWGGPRYSLWAVQAQLAMDRIMPPKRVKPYCPAQPIYQPMQNETAAQS